MRSWRGVPTQLFLRDAETQARCVLINDQATNALCLIIAGTDHDNIDVIIASARNKLLCAIQHIMIAIAPRCSFERRCIRPAARFREAIAGDFVHRHKVRQIARLKLCIAKAIDHPCRHIVDGDKGAGGRATIGHGFHDQRGFQTA